MTGKKTPYKRDRYFKGRLDGVFGCSDWLYGVFLSFSCYD
jgi:hypothetical protein